MQIMLHSYGIWLHCMYLYVFAFIVPKSSPHDEIPMNSNPAYKMMSLDSSKESTRHGDYENVVQPQPASMTSDPAYVFP